MRVVCAVNSEEFALREDFQRWKRGAGFCFCWYPFVFEAASKAALLDIENQGEQVRRCVRCDASCLYPLADRLHWKAALPAIRTWARRCVGAHTMKLSCLQS